MLSLENINKKLGNFSLTDINFSVNNGDYFVLIGESGAGKSMLLDIITGALEPDTGSIFLNEKNLLKIPIQKRNIGIVYQKPSLFPHMTVFDNIAYPLKIRKYSKEEIKLKVEELAESTEVTAILNRNITNLSGGETQRVTIARALATNPDVLLLDEPLSYLDVQLRKGMLTLLRKLNQKGQTIIHVTHDYEETLSLTNKIAILEKGKIIQTGSPQDVFENPKSVFVANFIGIKNFFNGVIVGQEENTHLKIFETSKIQLQINTKEEINSVGYITIPGDSILISNKKPDSSTFNNLQGIIKDIFPSRYGMEITMDIGMDISAHISNPLSDQLQLKTGTTVWLSLKTSAINFIKL